MLAAAKKVERLPLDSYRENRDEMRLDSYRENRDEMSDLVLPDASLLRAKLTERKAEDESEAAKVDVDPTTPKIVHGLSDEQRGVEDWSADVEERDDALSTPFMKLSLEEQPLELDLGDECDPIGEEDEPTALMAELRGELAAELIHKNAAGGAGGFQSPVLIKDFLNPNIYKVLGNMVYDPTTKRWEGNTSELKQFEHRTRTVQFGGQGKSKAESGRRKKTRQSVRDGGL